MTLKSILFIYLSFFLLVSHKVTSQQIDKRIPGVSSGSDFPTNPSLWEFSNYSDQKNVDLYTGKVDVRIPIHSVQDKDISVPISLRYKSGGVMVDKYSGWVGLDWQLSAGGYISREVRGNPDEEILRTNPTTGSINVENLGRFHDLIENSTDYALEQIPLNNTNNDYVMDDYVAILKNQTPIDCSSNRFPLPGLADCPKTCHYVLADAIAQNPHASNINAAGSNIFFFWNRFRDTEPDLFHYSVPNAAGSFVLDRTGKPILINGTSDVVIKPGIGPLANANGWEIITPDGILHTFPTSDQYTETTKKSTMNNEIIVAYSLTGTQYIIPYSGNPDKSMDKESFKSISVFPDQYDGIFDDYRKENKVVNTWHLSTIHSKKTNSTITFSYDVHAPIEDFYHVENRLDYVRTLRKRSPGNDMRGINGCEEMTEELAYTTEIIPSLTSPSLGYSPETINYPGLISPGDGIRYFPVLRTIMNPKTIRNIHFSSGEVKFILNDEDRWDMPGNHALKNIRLEDLHSKLIKEYKFEYGIFYETPYVNLEESSRLKLVNFKELSRPDNEGLQKAIGYSFEYYDGVLQHQHSVKQDYWGYQNNNTATTLIPEGNRYGVHFNGADRSPDEEKTKIGLLKTVTYPTGGHTEFFYEQNKYRDNIYRIERAIGGLRVSKTITVDPQVQNSEIIKEYSYGAIGFSSGNTSLFSDINWWRFFQNDSKFSFTDNNGNFFDEHLYVKRSSENLHQYSYTKGNIVGYNKITVSQDGNGKVEYRFTNALDFPDEESNKLKFPWNQQSGSDGYHEDSHIDKDALRGLLTHKVEYDETGKLIGYEKNDYENNPPNHSIYELNTLRIENEYTQAHLVWDAINTFTSWRDNHYLMDFGSIKSLFPYLSKKTVRTYNSDDNDYVESIHDYHKNGSSHMQTTSHVFETSDAENIVRHYYYPQDVDVSSMPFMSNLTADNRVSEVVKQQTFKDGELTSTLITNYEVYNNSNPNIGEKILLKSISNKKGNSSIVEQEGHIDLRDENGNVLQYTTRGGEIHVYIWGYENNIPIAKIMGDLTYEEVNSGLVTEHGFGISEIRENSNLDDDNCREPSCKEEILRAKLGVLRDHFPNALITTYTYDPLVGMTSMTDSRAYTIYYEYDNFNRLKMITDADGNLVEEYAFNHKNEYNEYPEFSATISAPSQVARGTTVNVATTVSGGSGSFTYNWTTSNDNMNQTSTNTTGNLSITTNTNHQPSFIVTCVITDNNTGNQKTLSRNVDVYTPGIDVYFGNISQSGRRKSARLYGSPGAVVSFRASTGGSGSDHSGFGSFGSTSFSLGSYDSQTGSAIIPSSGYFDCYVEINIPSSGSTAANINLQIMDTTAGQIGSPFSISSNYSSF